VLPGFLLAVDSRSRSLFRIFNASLFEKHTCADLIDLGHDSRVSQIRVNASCTVQVLVSFFETVNGEVDIAKLDLNVS